MRKISDKKKTTAKKTKKRFLKKDLDKYKEMLLNLRDDIIKQIRNISEDTLKRSPKDTSGDISGYTLHLADVATDSYEREFNIGIASEERRVLLEIDDALKRVDDKTYGQCKMCSHNIAKTRLKAIPYARYCRKCKEALEKEGKI